MKKSSKLLILLGVLVLVVAAYFIIPLAISVKQEIENPSDEPDYIQVFSTARESILEIEWTYLEETNTIVRDTPQGAWYCPDDLMFAVDQNIGEAMVASVYSIIADSSLEPAEDLAEYNLDPPLIYVKITLDNGEEHTFGTGKYNSFAEAYYMSYNDYADIIYICENPPMEAFAYLREDIGSSAEDVSDSADSSAGDVSDSSAAN